MNLKLKVFRVQPEDTASDPTLDATLPWRWAVIDLNHEGGWWKISPWSWPRRAVVDHGRAPDGATALRIGLVALTDAHRDTLVGAR